MDSVLLAQLALILQLDVHLRVLQQDGDTPKISCSECTEAFCVFVATVHVKFGTSTCGCSDNHCLRVLAISMRLKEDEVYSKEIAKVVRHTFDVKPSTEPF